MESVHSRNPPIAPDFDTKEMEGEECVRRALEEVEVGFGSHADCATKTASKYEETSFVDIMGGMGIGTGRESGEMTFTDVLQRADLLYEFFGGN